MRKDAKTQKIFENRPTLYLLWAAFLNGRYNMVSVKLHITSLRNDQNCATCTHNDEFPEGILTYNQS